MIGLDTWSNSSQVGSFLSLFLSFFTYFIRCCRSVFFHSDNVIFLVFLLLQDVITCISFANVTKLFLCSYRILCGYNLCLLITKENSDDSHWTSGQSFDLRYFLWIIGNLPLSKRPLSYMSLQLLGFRFLSYLLPTTRYTFSRKHLLIIGMYWAYQVP